jgi:hypothetical protein
MRGSDIHLDATARPGRLRRAMCLFYRCGAMANVCNISHVMDITHCCLIGVDSYTRPTRADRPLTCTTYLGG